MTPSEQTDLNYKKIYDEYNNTENIWLPEDKWHQYTKKRIDEFLEACLNKLHLVGNEKVLNAGSGGNEYCLAGFDHYHVDISEKSIQNKRKHVVSTIESIPLDGQLFDICLCVGSVINYCDAMKAINEFYRLLKPGGTLILEFENSNSF